MNSSETYGLRSHNEALKVNGTFDKKTFMGTYRNNTDFCMVDKNDVIISQNHVDPKGLIDHEEKATPNVIFNEYFLENDPIKMKRDDNGKYWIVDGHHRFYRGLLKGHTHFLSEVLRDRYKPPTNEPIKCVNLTRRDNDIILQKNDLSKQERSLVKQLNDKFMNVCHWF